MPVRWWRRWAQQWHVRRVSAFSMALQNGSSCVRGEAPGGGSKGSAHRARMLVRASTPNWHGLWLVLVATGVGQGVAEFVLRLHFLEPDITVQPFTVG